MPEYPGPLTKLKTPFDKTFGLGPIKEQDEAEDTVPPHAGTGNGEWERA